MLTGETAIGSGPAPCAPPPPVVPAPRPFAFEMDARIITAVKTRGGRVALFAISALFLAYAQRAWLPMLLGAAVCAYSRRYRVTALIAASAFVVGSRRACLGLAPLHLPKLGAAIAVGLLVATYLRAVRAHPKSFGARRPVVFLLSSIAALTAFAHVGGMLGDAAWQAVSLCTTLVWYVAYAAVDQRSATPSSWTQQLALLRPFWGPSTVPYGKGAGFLGRRMADTADELAVTQVKGAKLLCWSCILWMASELLQWSLDDGLQVPALPAVQVAFLAHRPHNLALAWSSLIGSVVTDALTWAAVGHSAIGVARLAGFYLPRNTWRPLESRNLADYWNRRYFYFKELLVDMFFYPTFFAWFRKSPRCRVFIATFAAAGLGNWIFHFVRDIHNVARLGLAGALSMYATYGFYCIVLAAGIGISQARARHAPPTPLSLLDRAGSFATVWGFVVCLHVFDDVTGTLTLSQHLRFFGSLFGVGS